MGTLAGAFVLGAGLADMGGPDFSAGVEAFGQCPLSPMFRIEAGFGVRLAPASTKTAGTMLSLAYKSDPNTRFQFPVTGDVIVVNATADLTPVPVLRAKGFTGALHLRGGIEGGVVEYQVATISDSYRAGESSDPVQLVETQPGGSFEVGPTLGVAIDAAFGKRFGIRWRGGTRLTIGTEPDYIVGDVDPTTGQAQVQNTELRSTMSWSLDLVVAL
jgi:hypothetical protein